MELYYFIEGKNENGKIIRRPVYKASDFTTYNQYGVDLLSTCTFSNILPVQDGTDFLFNSNWNTLHNSFNILGSVPVFYDSLVNTPSMVGVPQIKLNSTDHRILVIKDKLTIEYMTTTYVVAEKDSESNNYFNFTYHIVPLIRCLDKDGNDILSQANWQYENKNFVDLETFLTLNWYRDYYNLTLYVNKNWYCQIAPYTIGLARVDIVDAQEQSSKFKAEDFYEGNPIVRIAYDLIFKSNKEFTIKPKFRYGMNPLLPNYISDYTDYMYNQKNTPIAIWNVMNEFYGGDTLSYDCVWFNLGDVSIDLFESDEDETTDNDEVTDSAGKVNSTGGGGGDFDDSSDEIDIPSPSESNPALTSGLIRMWKISRNGLTDLVEFLWDDSISAAIKKLFSNPKDCICNLMTFPYIVTTREADKEIKLVGVDSGVTADPDVIAGQQIDCGSLDVNEYFGSFLDYQTNVSIYLPYIGIKSLNVNDVMDSNIHLVYNVDNQTGECVAFIKCNKFNQNLNSVMYSFSGNMGTQLPINSRDTSTQYLALLNATSQMVMGNYVSATNIAVTGLSPTIEKAGRLDSNSGNISVLKPYLIVERPMWQKPSNYGEYQGETAYIFDNLSNLSEYVEIEEVKSELNGVPKEMRDSIIDLLKDGVYI